jgi:predicted metalloprotease
MKRLLLPTVVVLGLIATGCAFANHSAAEDALVDFLARVLGNTEDIWDEIFTEAGQTYQKPKMILFTDVEQTPCGTVQGTSGPFYCPIDQRIYLDPSFLAEMKTRFPACSSDEACQFSRAVSIAREVGHHVQNLLGILAKVKQAQQASSDPSVSRNLQARTDLQADCLAGLWANRSNRKRQFIDPQALQRVIDEDRQRQSTVQNMSEQRVHWFVVGLQQGTVQACNTFGVSIEVVKSVPTMIVH